MKRFASFLSLFAVFLFCGLATAAPLEPATTAPTYTLTSVSPSPSAVVPATFQRSAQCSCPLHTTASPASQTYYSQTYNYSAGYGNASLDGRPGLPAVPLPS